MLHQFAKFVSACTVILVLAGSLVTSTGSGLAVPDWPTTYGWNMFTFPPSKWVGGILYEHGHRLIATTVGVLTIVLAAWLWHSEARRWLKRLGLVALATVVVQGLLGGITVLYFLPTAVSTAHAALAQVFFCLTVAIALFTSRAWIGAEHPPDDGRLRWLATAATAIIYVQILVGAAMRHTGAGLAIPDFPLMFGGIVPDRWSAPIAVHFAHRAGALLVIGAVSATALYVRARHSGHRKLRGPATVILGLVAVQIALGASTVLTERNVWVNSSHVVVGALTLATSLVITLRSWRVKFGLSGVGRDWTAAVARGADAADAARSAAGAERGRVDRTRARA